MRFSIHLFRLAVLATCASPALAGDFVMSLTPEADRHWIGPEYWTNPLQDWRLANHRVEARVSGGDRNVALLTRALDESVAPLEMVVRFGALEGDVFEPESGWVGFRIGARGEFDDYRDDALRGRGLDLGVLADGSLFVGRPEPGAASLPARIGPFALRARFDPRDAGYALVLMVEDGRGEVIAQLERDGIDPSWLVGGLALVASSTPPVPVDPRAPRPAELPVPDTRRGGDMRVWFDEWRMESPKLVHHPERSYGPVLFSMYTLSRGVLRITAQMAAVDQPPGELGLEMQGPRDSGWRWLGSAQIDPLTYVATWRVEPWIDTHDVRYRILTGMRGQMGEPVRYEFPGTIRKDPRERGELVVAAFTGNNDLGFPHQDVVQHVSSFDPDVLLFTGDQIYETVGGFGVQRAPLQAAVLDYLRKWALFGWEYRDLLRDRPSLCLPDDHDVYHGNLWGAGGKIADGGGMQGQDSGGYTMELDFVNAVQATQTRHHPDPASPTPVGAGVDVYYGDMLYGGVSFAVIEDRKWKSAPAALLPEAKIVNGWAKNPDYDAARDGDVDGAVLLGEPQLEFLEEWADDWSGGAWMKVVVSQTLFANVATLPPPADTDAVTPKLRIVDPGEYPEGELPVQDHDSNGWPQAGRRRALERMRRGFAFHIAGDQHLGSSIRYGLDEWGDAGWAICVPSVANFFPRRWFPSEEGANRAADAPRYTGDYLDGFGNKVTVAAVSNPVRQGVEPAKLHDRAPGYGIVRFDKRARTIEMANWPRWVDPAQPDAEPYPGWPITIGQLDNYGRAATGYLPSIEITGAEDPVVRVISEADGEIVYSLRIQGTRFVPFVFEPGTYTIEVETRELGGEPTRLEGLTPSAQPDVERRTIQVENFGR